MANGEKWLGLCFTAFVLGYGVATCDALSFCSGFFAGAGTIVTIGLWLEGDDIDDDDAEPRS